MALPWAPAKPPGRRHHRSTGFGWRILATITVGACNEDGPADQWDDRRTHNAALSYAAMTADAFSADYRNISVSGMGISTGWVGKVTGEIWNKIYPSAASPQADLTIWKPQVVFVNYGENDDSYPHAHGQPFPAGFTDAYIAFVHDLRAAYPAAHIVLLRGGMFGGAQSQPLRQAWGIRRDAARSRRPGHQPLCVCTLDTHPSARGR